MVDTWFNARDKQRALFEFLNSLTIRLAAGSPFVLRPADVIRVGVSPRLLSAPVDRR
jgi:hypothetical protein